MELNTDRFERSLRVLAKSLGPDLITRIHAGLTPGQVFLLFAIEKNDDHCTVSRLAEMLEVAPSAVTVMLDRLENHGYVLRVRESTDRRVVVTALTDLGRETLGQVLGVRKRVISRCLRQLDDGQLESFMGALESLAAVVQTVDIDTLIAPANRSGE